ncbi:MAG: L,D-transpeptidase [Clostridium sp.]|nr:L,D-transpeptidase [Clostridium sp.]
MKKRSSLTFMTNSKPKNNFKLSLLSGSMILVLTSIIIYEFFSYKVLFNNFKTQFDNNKFSNANTLLITKGNFNPFKSLFLETDLSKYLNTKLDNISSNNDSNLLNEIQRYSEVTNCNSDVLNKLNITYENGVNFFNEKKYIQAYNIFSKIKFTDNNFSSSIEYIRICKKNIITEVLTQVNNLCKDSKYDDALNLLCSVNYIVGDNQDIVSKIEELKIYTNNYSYKGEDLATSASADVSKVASVNINKLSLDSHTPFLIQVDLTNQVTNIFKGKKNSWNLIKTFSCSSGIQGEDTPTGTFTIKEKGDWFFSERYKQGGKYWVQFSGNYLFHSLPYAKDKSTIVDFTLGKPASHGCIRLRELDCKWIYDNIPKGSKVIIQ